MWKLLNLFSCPAKSNELVPKRMKRKTSQAYMIFRKSEYFSNPKIFYFFSWRFNFAGDSQNFSLDVISRIVYLIPAKFNHFKAVSILSFGFFFLGFIFIFQGFIIHRIVLHILLFYCGFLMLSGFDQFTKEWLILRLKNQFIRINSSEVHPV